MIPEQKSDSWWLGQYVDTRNTRGGSAAKAFLESIPQDVMDRIGEDLMVFEKLRQQGRKDSKIERERIGKLIADYSNILNEQGPKTAHAFLSTLSKSDRQRIKPTTTLIGALHPKMQ